MRKEIVDPHEIQRLYEITTILDSTNLETANSAVNEKLFEEILQGAQGTRGAKVLAAQFIPKYLKIFQKSIEKAMNTLMDLCEEDDVQIRVSAIRSLPTIAKDTPDSLPKIADILGQLLQAEDRLELDNVKHALSSLLRLDAEGTLGALFNQILTGDEVLRDKAISFVFEKVFAHHDELIDDKPDVQKALSEHIKKVLRDASGNEFQMFFDILRKLPLHINGSTELLGVVIDQIESNVDFKPEEQHVYALLTCLHLAQPYYKEGISSVRIAQYLADKVFPVFTQLSEQQQSQLIKQIAELMPYTSGDDAKVLLKPVYELLLIHAPLTNEAKTHFTITEAILLIFHHLAPKAAGQLRSLCGITVMTGQPSDLVGEPSVDHRKDLEARLKVLEESTKAYVVKVRHALDVLQNEVASAKDVAKKAELNTKKDKLDIALKTTQNVQTLTQALLKPAAVFLKLGPSWKSGTKQPQNEVSKTTLPPGKRRILTLTNNITPKSTTPKATPKLPSCFQLPSVPVTTTQPTADTFEKKQRPSFSQVYVPPNRQGGIVLPKRRVVSNNTNATNKKFKRGGSNTF